MKLFFWRRFAAGWVDVFLIYALASLVLALSALLGLRVALEPSFVVLGAAYGAVALCRRGQTVGKAVWGLAVESSSGGKLSLARVFAREVFGKWLLSVAAPVAVGRAWLKNAWVPTVFEMLAVGCVLILGLGYGFCARRAWYDSLAGTVVRRVPAPAGFPRMATVLVLGAAVLAWGSKALEYVNSGRLACRVALHQSMRSTRPYVDFLARKPSAPVDYVLGLFERYDVVVLCERAHPEASQWDFIFDLVRDPRFVERVGHVFTEYGNSAMQPALDEFLSRDGLSSAEAGARAVHLMRHWSVWPVWPNVNFHTYLTRLYALNQSLPPAKRIRHHFTDVAEDWGRLNAGNIAEHWRAMGTRDEYMAGRVIEEMRRLGPREGKPAKCLVVMNFRHAFDLTGRRPQAARENTYESIRDAFGGRAANVLLNTHIPCLGPIAGGLWDAAFEATRNRPAGFDFTGSPFGEDRFDLFVCSPPIQSRFRYRDVFTGFVFTHPFQEQYSELGIPGYFAGFEPEMRRRAALLGDSYSRTVEQMIRQEQQGKVNLKRSLSGSDAGTWVELGLLGFASVGLLCYGAAWGLFRAESRRERRRCASDPTRVASAPDL